MRPDDIFWRLHFFLPATLGARPGPGPACARSWASRRRAGRAGTLSGVALRPTESFHFNFAVVNAETGVTVVEDGGRCGAASHAAPCKQR